MQNIRKLPYFKNVTAEVAAPPLCERIEETDE